ncbi:MAG: hypothetical protein WC775_06160 [Patescibacteria group bacterium]|jgi:hypothetical protein
MVRYYQFTPHLSVSVTAAKKQYIRYFDSEYWFAKSSKKLPVDIELRVVDSLSNRSDDAHVVFRSIKFKNLFWFEYQIDFASSPIQITVKRHFIDSIYFKAFGPFIQTNILEPILYYVAVHKKQYVLHAATIAKDAKATCIVGKGGAGKTTTCLNKCMKEGYSFMGDDLIFVDATKRNVHWFPRPLHLFGYNMFKIPTPHGLKGKLLFWKLLAIIRLKDVMRFLLTLISGQKLLISTRIDMRLLYPSIHLVKLARLDQIETLKLNSKNLVQEIEKASDLRADLVTLIKKLPKNVQEEFYEKENAVLISIC